jgi:rubrerythrin
MVNLIVLETEYSSKNKEPLSHYSRGSKVKVWWTCSICSHEWLTRIGHRFNGAGCPSCGKRLAHLSRARNRPSIIATHPVVALEWDDPYDIGLVSAGSNKTFNWRCRTCLRNFSASPNRRCLRQSGCPFCSGRLATEHNRLDVLRPDLAEDLVDQSLLPTLCANSSKRLSWRCRRCSHVWDTTVNNRFRGTGCPKCAWKNSTPQRTISKWLTQRLFKFTVEHRIPACRHILPLPFDFAIFNGPDLAHLIEYHGQQHYRPIWGQESLQKVRLRDRIKFDFCKTNEIPLLVIPFWKWPTLDMVLSQVLDSPL